MSLDPTSFENVVPSRYITFTFPYPHPDPHRLLHIAVLDSPSPPPSPSSNSTAAMWVPPGRESDWTFSTFSGHLQLLLSSSTRHPLSRLILIGNTPKYPHPTSYIANPCPSFKQLEPKLTPLLLALTPRSAFLQQNGNFPDVPFLAYEDDLDTSIVLEICEGPYVGEMVIEDVKLGGEFRRRLRFKRMPNLVQTQMRIYPKNREELDNIEFELDNKVLVHPYLCPMVVGISVIGFHLERRLNNGFRPKALCLGIGGGALLGFLNAQFGFEVVGVEEDEVVIEVAKRYFGLESNELIRLCVGEAMNFTKKLAKGISVAEKFDVVMVDLDSSDVGMHVTAPPVEFVEKSVLLGVRAVLHEHGVFIINVIPASESFYERLICEFQQVFSELYEVDVGNEENFVLVATVSEVGTPDDDCRNSYLQKLQLIDSGQHYIDRIRKISRQTFS